MNFIKSIFGAGKPNKEQQQLEEYAEFLAF